MSKVSIKTKAKASFLLLFKEVELLLCPLIVFSIGYMHHLYFSYDLISPIFVAGSIVSTIFVLAYGRSGFIAAALLQIFILGYVVYKEPFLIYEQMAFSLSVVTALAATFLSRQEEVVSTRPKTTLTLSEQKDKLWQELFDARKEISSLYGQKEELATMLSVLSKEHEQIVLLLQHRLEAIETEKHSLYEAQVETERDIGILLEKMRDMAEEQTELQKQIVDLKTIAPVVVIEDQISEVQEDVKKSLEPYEAMYRQLKAQFDDKGAILDVTRKELFLAQEEIEILNRTLELEVRVPTEMEKVLCAQLKATEHELEAMCKKQQEELLGYEGVIQGLLQQLAAVS